MKRILFLALLATISITSYSQQAKKPRIMVVPDKNWCISKGYCDELGNPNYTRALQDENMSGMITIMGDIMADYGYKLVHLSTALNKMDKEQGMDMVLKSKRGGEIVESDLDRAVREVQADILINLSYRCDERAVRRVVDYNVTSVDAATAKQISGDVGHSQYSSAPASDLMNDAVYGFMDNFCTKLDMHFNDMAENGREGSVIFYVAEDCPFNFDSEFFFNGETGELSELIEYWLNENTVRGAFNLTNESDVRLDFEDVRFPPFKEGKFSGKIEPTNVTSFIRPIDKFLAPFGISCKFQSVGIGQVYVVLGSK